MKVCIEPFCKSLGKAMHLQLKWHFLRAYTLIHIGYPIKSANRNPSIATPQDSQIRNVNPYTVCNVIKQQEKNTQHFKSGEI